MSNVFLISCLSLTQISCSSLLQHREGKASTTNVDEQKFVPKEQFDELSRKYNELLGQKKNEAVATNLPSSNSELNKSTAEQIAPENNVQSNLDPSELVNKIDQALPDPSLGVDTFSEEGKAAINKAGPKLPDAMGVEHVNFTDDVDEQIAQMREASELIKVNKFENALVILKQLENSKEKQVVVRSKMMLGDLLFNQGEYDLALQVYEEVIKKYAFSAYVLKALGKLVACCEKLKLPEKGAKYYSLLHDFFESA